MVLEPSCDGSEDAEKENLIWQDDPAASVMVPIAIDEQSLSSRLNGVSCFSPTAGAETSVAELEPRFVRVSPLVA